MGNTAFPLARFQQAGVSAAAITTLTEAWALMSPEAQAAENLYIEGISNSEVAAIASFGSGGGVPTLSGGIVEVDTGGGGGVTDAGDLGGTSASPTVVGLQGRPVTSTAPTSGQALVWNGSGWAPATVSGSGLSGVTVSGTPSAGEVLTATSSSAASWQAGSGGGTAASTTYNSTSATGPTEGTTDVQDAILAIDADLASDDPQIEANTTAIAANAAQIAANTAQVEANTALIALTTGNQSPAVTGIWGARLTGFGSIRFVSALGALRGHWTASTAYAQGDDVDTNVATLLTTALTTSGAITSLAVNAPENSIPSGVSVTLTDPTGAYSQTFTTSSATAYNATAVAISSATPNYAYPVGSTLVYANPGNYQALVAHTSGTAFSGAGAGTLGTALTTTGNITTLALSGVLKTPAGANLAVTNGSNIVVISADGTERQRFQLNANYAAGAASMTVASQTPSFAFAVGSVVSTVWTQVPEQDGDRLALQG